MKTILHLPGGDRIIHPRRRVLVSLLPLLVFLASGRSEAQCNTNCNPTGGGVSCTVALTQSPCVANGNVHCTNYPPSETMVMTTVLSATSASCLPGATGDSIAMAVHTSGQGVPAQCGFRFRVARCSSGINCSAAFAETVVCTVDDASDGLPVELMEFSVEDEDEDSPLDD